MAKELRYNSPDDRPFGKCIRQYGYTLFKHKEKIEADFTTCPPHTVSEAQSRIEQLSGIKRSQTQIRKFLRRIGLKSRKTAIVPGKIDDDKIGKQRKFKRNQLDPPIKEAQVQKRKLFFC